MPPTVILIRHAQAQHNLTKDYSIPDPPLTEQGLEQCVPLRDSLRDRFGHIAASDAVILASPMHRTLQTTELGLGWLIGKGVKIVADPDWQENSAKPCDTGSPVPDIAARHPTVDFSSVDPVWPDKTSPAAERYHHTRDAILQRGRRCRDALAERPEKYVFVVSHSGFLRLGVVGWWFYNADYRVFNFELGDDGTTQVLTQHPDTKTGGLGWSLPEPVTLGLGLPAENTPEESVGDSVV